MKITTKSKRHYEGDLFGVEQKKFAEIPSTANEVISANVDLP